MKNKKRILAAICASAVLLSAFAGCSDKPTDDNKDKDNSSSAPTSTPSKDNADADKDKDKDKDKNNGEGATLLWWSIGEQPDDLADGLKEINAYTQEKIGVGIDLKLSGWGDWDTKMNTIINSGEAFDMMFTNSSKYNAQVNLNAFADITDLVQSETPDLYSFIPETVWQGTKIHNKIYAVPTYKDSSITQYWVFDDSYVQKYNIDVASIKTLEDLDQAARTIKEGEGKNVYPIPMTQSEGLNGFFNNYDDLTLGLPPVGVKMSDGERKVVSVLEQDDIMAGLKIINGWFKDGVVNPDAPTATEPTKGRIIFSAQAFPGAEVTYQINEGVEKYVMTQVYGPMYSTATIQGSLNAISANSKYVKEGLKFLELVNTDSTLRNMMAYGIEGTHFKKVEGKENVIEKLTDTWTLSAYTQGTFFNMAIVDGSPEDQWKQVQKLNESADFSSCLGFALDISNLSTEVANCKTTWDKYRYELLTGASNPEEMIPKIVEELKASGMEKIMEEAQKQIDEFFAQ